MPTFRAYEYQLANDSWDWVDYTREALLDQCVMRAFAKRYERLLMEGAKIGCMYRVPSSTADVTEFAHLDRWRDLKVMLRHILRGVQATVLSASEIEAIYTEWDGFWRGRKVMTDGAEPG